MKSNMNTHYIQNTQHGFRRNDTLASNLKFSGHIRIWEIVKSQKFLPDGDTFDYWVIKDEFGARLTCIDEKLANSLVIAERYEVRGEIKIGKGGTFLNLKSANPLNGGNFQEV